MTKYKNFSCSHFTFFLFLRFLFEKKYLNRLILLTLFCLPMALYGDGMYEIYSDNLFKYITYHGSGQITINVAGEATLFPAEITISPKGITIVAQKELFAPININNAKQSKQLFIAPEDFSMLQFSFDEIFIVASESFYKRYAHLFFNLYKSPDIFSSAKENYICFKLDFPAPFEQQCEKVVFLKEYEVFCEFTREILVHLAEE